jgi:hypothetical protein
VAEPLFYLLHFASTAAVIAIGEEVGEAYAKTKFTDSEIRANRRTKTIASNTPLLTQSVFKLL